MKFERAHFLIVINYFDNFYQFFSKYFNTPEPAAKYWGFTQSDDALSNLVQILLFRTVILNYCQ